MVALGGIVSLAIGAGGAYFFGPTLLGTGDADHVRKVPPAELRLERSERAYPLSGVVLVGSHPLDYAIVTVGTESLATDETGAFSFTSAPLGEITVTRPGYNSLEYAFDGSVEEVDLLMEPVVVRALYVSPWTNPDDDATFQKYLDLAAVTTVNALVFDTKGDYDGGYVFYDTQVPAAITAGAVDVRYDVTERLQQTHDAGLYAVSRIPVFISETYVKAFPEHRLVGQYLNPGNRDAWEYALDLAVEACGLGFDEIQFDYIRYPDSQAASQAWKLGLIPDEETRVANVSGFLEEASDQLHPLGCAVSANTFGGVTVYDDDRDKIGQRLEDFTRPLDAYSPMTYPSLWATAWFGFSNPNAHPKEVVAAQLDSAMPRVAEWTTVRPWLQGWGYTSTQIRSEIDAADERGLGWIIWNVSGDYSASALPPGTVGAG